MSALYLALPAGCDPETLARLLDAANGAVESVRFPAQGDETRLRETAAAMLTVTEPREIALLIEDRVDLVRPLKLDGVHLASFATAPKDARQILGTDFIVGAFAGASQHRAMVMAEMGADYVALGPVAEVEHDLYRWWADTVETPLVAEGCSQRDAEGLAAIADFIVPDSALWSADDPAEAIAAYAKAISA